jgi:hypothetical protein
MHGRAQACLPGVFEVAGFSRKTAAQFSETLLSAFDAKVGAGLAVRKGAKRLIIKQIPVKQAIPPEHVLL